MSQDTSDSVTCVSTILSNFKRKASPNRLSVEETSRPVTVATKLVFDAEDTDIARNAIVKRKKIDSTSSSSNESGLNISVPGKDLHLYYFTVLVCAALAQITFNLLFRFTMGNSFSAKGAD